MRKVLELVRSRNNSIFNGMQRRRLPQMLVLYMNFQIIWSVTFEMTILTWKWLFFSMNQNVQSHLCRFFHFFWTIRTSPPTRSQMNWIILQWIWGLNEIKKEICKTRRQFIMNLITKLSLTTVNRHPYCRGTKWIVIFCNKFQMVLC